jgi:hypothetical protein
MPDPDRDDLFTAEEAVVAQRDLRHAVGLKSELFPLPAFIGKISDEIEQMRAAGFDDGEIAMTVRDSIGREISGEEIARHYAPAEKRRRG